MLMCLRIITSLISWICCRLKTETSAFTYWQVSTYGWMQRMYVLHSYPYIQCTFRNIDPIQQSTHSTASE